MSPRGLVAAFSRFSRAARRHDGQASQARQRRTARPATRAPHLAAESLESRCMLSTTARLENNISMFDRIPVIHPLRPANVPTSFVGQFAWSGFNSFCVEIGQSISPGLHTFSTRAPLASSGLANAGLVADFWRSYGPKTTGFTSVTDAAAFQLGIWELISDGPSRNLKSGSFQVDASASPAVARAESWLNGTGTPAPSAGGPAVSLYVLQHPTRQDQVVWEPLPNITVQVAQPIVAEDGPQKLTYTFTATGPLTRDVTVNYSVGGSATAGSDFTGLPAGASTGSITIPANSSTPGSAATLTITPTPDTVIEFDETVVISLLPGTGYTFDTTRPPATGTIENDDYLLDLILDVLPEETASEPNELSPGAILPIGGGRTRLDLIVESPGYAGTVTLFVTTGADVADAVTLWDAEEDGTQVLPTTWQVGQHPRTLWVETTGVAADIQFIAMFQNNGTTKQDAAKAIAVASRPDITFDPNEITARVSSWMNGLKNRLEDQSTDTLNLDVNGIRVDHAIGTFRSIKVVTKAMDDPAIGRVNPESFYFKGKQTKSSWGIFRGVDHNPGAPYAWLRDYHPEVGVRTPNDFRNLPDDDRTKWAKEFERWSDPLVTAQRMTGTLDVTYVYAGKLDPATTWIRKRNDFVPPALSTPPGSTYPYDRPLNVDYSNWVEENPHHAVKPVGWDLTSTLTLHFEVTIDLENDQASVTGTWVIDDIHGMSNGVISVKPSVN